MRDVEGMHRQPAESWGPQVHATTAAGVRSFQGPHVAGVRISVERCCDGQIVICGVDGGVERQRWQVMAEVLGFGTSAS